MTGGFAQNRPRGEKKVASSAKEKAVVEKGADKAEKNSTPESGSLDPKAPANKSMTFPMNEYELKMLQDLAESKSEEFGVSVSMRQIGRQVLARALRAELDQN